jgi:uncharacterized protein YbjQ (UPF0145 family)
MAGIVVMEVTPSGQADKIGIRLHDVLYKYNDKILGTSEDLASARAAKAEGELIAIRGGKLITLVVVAGALGITLVPYPIPDVNIPGVEEVFSRIRGEAPHVTQAEVDEQKAILLAKIASIKATTTQSLEGYRVTQTLDIITAEYVGGMNIFRDFLAGVRDMVGGRSGTIQNELRNAREVCIANLKQEAYSLGANAVLAVDLDYSEISGGGKSMLFLVASGTAVIVEKV